MHVGSNTGRTGTPHLGCGCADVESKPDVMSGAFGEYGGPEFSPRRSSITPETGIPPSRSWPKYIPVFPSSLRASD